MSAHTSTLTTPVPATPISPWGTLFAQLLWMTLQAAALAATVYRLPLGRDYTLAEGLAIQVMVVVQTVIGAMLFPILMRDRTGTAATLASAAMFFQFSCFLAANPENGRIIWCGLYVGGWLITLALLSWLIQSPTGKMWGVVGAVGVSVGGVLLAYLRREFAIPDQTQFEWAQLGFFGPTMGGIMVLESGRQASGAWAVLGVFFGLTGIAALVKRSISFKHQK